MEFPVIKAAAYAMIHSPHVLLEHGTTITMEKLTNPDSLYLKSLSRHLRTFAEAVNYPPNQTYIGNLSLEQLQDIPRPWYLTRENFPAQGKWGEIVDEAEFYGLLKISDRFNLVELESAFAQELKSRLENKEIYTPAELQLLDKGRELSEIQEMIDSGSGVGLFLPEGLVGYVREAHEHDSNLTAQVVLENLASKASALLAVKNLLYLNSIDPASVDYIIDTSEEAIGDMNQRGGGNLAKSIGEAAGLVNASGFDLRAFCAGPAHGLVTASAFVQAGIFKNVLIVGGGSTAKLGMNSKDHIAKEMPVLEDMLGAFALLISENDVRSPVLRTDIVGKHLIGSGSAPQAVIQALVVDPLLSNNLSIKDVDYYAPELQNPEITVPAGAGDVPLANYKMIGAMAVKRGELERAQLLDFCAQHGFVGFAPTQGHIPSGIPAVGHIIDKINRGEMNRAMVIGKGSLFLGRMTDLFDGISIIIEKNQGQVLAPAVRAADTPAAAPDKNRTRIGLTIGGSEISTEDLLEAARQAAKADQELEVVIIGDCTCKDFAVYPAASEEEIRQTSEKLLQNQEIHGLVTMHYPFPIGVTTIGKVITPARGKAMYIASTTGTADTNRVQAMVKNAVYGLAAARTEGISQPTLGILNVDGARSVERHLEQMRQNGYDFTWGSSSRRDGGRILRGNDLVDGSVDVCVTDSLTGNVLMKLFSSFNSGGQYETSGYGYGPGIGEDFSSLINIISRASGTPVVKSALLYCAAMARNNWLTVVKEEAARARQSGWIIDTTAAPAVPAEEISSPPVKVTDSEIHGIDILELDNAVKLLWKQGIYAGTGMGCTGPVVMIAKDDFELAHKILRDNAMISDSA